jgi:hypothetical protein
MRGYNFYYYGELITRDQFSVNVPHNWEDLAVDQNYTYGGYKAIGRDQQNVIKSSKISQT